MDQNPYQPPQSDLDDRNKLDKENQKRSLMIASIIVAIAMYLVQILGSSKELTRLLKIPDETQLLISAALVTVVSLISALVYCTPYHDRSAKLYRFAVWFVLSALAQGVSFIIYGYIGSFF